jgi:putative hydrolase of the HAD superfamily
LSGPAPLRAVLFDAAGTLIETAEPVGATYARFARAQGVELGAARLGDAFRRILAQAPPMAFAGEGPAGVAAAERDWWRQIVRGTFRASDATAQLADFEACFTGLWEHFAGSAAWRCRAGAEAALAALRAAGLATALVSNFDQRLPGILEGLGLGEAFDVVVLPADAGAAKPDPRIFELALARLGIAAAQAVYVGDDAEQDLRAARRAGLRAIDVASLATLAELPDLLVPLRAPRQETR